jgi:hypothetical protein
VLRGLRQRGRGTHAVARTLFPGRIHLMFQKHWLLVGILIVGSVVLYMILRNPTQKALVTMGSPTVGGTAHTPTLSGVWNNIADAFGSIFGRSEAPIATDAVGFGEAEYAD